MHACLTEEDQEMATSHFVYFQVDQGPDAARFDLLQHWLH
jgi:hypothetical protein